ncbi:hypothetical protein E2C01_091717 [Portunus trituberculatus]|uniref:Uncharacterized protein n=1 Tax=Portunus trituberculatus TaxID=210409 RepID=A0A5B7JTP1_PORTR|nr:hypothetical protein [Portunus trituberculatus]
MALTRSLLGPKLHFGGSQKALADTCWSARLGRHGSLNMQYNTRISPVSQALASREPRRSGGAGDGE